ncbi:MAG: hypothetical protein KKA60_09545 [Proteobacteria bacterium]|nr:hypothetical protein [Pseudomonadota bacterium]
MIIADFLPGKKRGETDGRNRSAHQEGIPAKAMVFKKQKETADDADFEKISQMAGRNGQAAPGIFLAPSLRNPAF